MRDIEHLCPGCMNETDGGAVCSFCGRDRNEPAPAEHLPIGTKIKKRYLVGAAIESNGEGITYICYDAKEDKTVCLREFFPAGLCERSAVGSVEVLPGKEQAFTITRGRFLDLAVKLRDHTEIPAILTISEIFDGNGTSYYIYDHFEGITLREFLLRNGGTLQWEQARPIFLSLAASLHALHDLGILHRGVSPETVLVGKDGKVRLVGFCIADARKAGTTLSAQLFPGFAAVEQYGSIGTEGSWTDVYGLAATMYRVLVGNPPVEASDRLTNDTLTVSSKATETIPEPVLEVMAGGLQIMPEDRIASMEEFREELAAVPGASEEDKPNAGANKEKQKSYMFVAAMMTILVLLIGFALLYFLVLRPRLNDTSSTASSSPVSSVVSTVSAVSSEQKIGTVQVEDFAGKTYQALLEDAAYGKYHFVIDAKKYDDAYGVNRILKQSPDAGAIVDPDTADGKVTVHLELSLGSYYVNLPETSGMPLDKAMLELVKAGIPYPNIRVVEKYNPSAAPEAIIEMSPVAGSRVNPDETVTVTYNTYQQTEPASETETEPEEKQ